MTPRSVLIVGAGLAGARCAETLRNEGYDGPVTLVGDEPVAPYERPALSKEFLAGERSAGELLLRPPGFWAEHEIELVLGRRIEALEPEPGGTVVIATGARARRPPIPGADRAPVLRTLADARALRAELRPARRLVIVGCGFVGAEVASTARGLGVDVTVLEAGPAPFASVLGADVGELLADRYRSHGVDLRTGTTAEAIEEGRVVLAGGERIECDAVLLAVGVEPAGDLLRDGVHACGDVAGGPGHWTSAAGDGVATARRILGLMPLPAQPAFFWSDQFGVRLQLAGDPRGAASVELDRAGEGYAAHYLARDGRRLAALGANRPGEVAAFRRELACAA